MPITLTRRVFLRTTAAALLVPRRRDDDPDAGRIMTVTGPVDPATLGVTLPHEHIMVDFVGAKEVSPQRYKSDEVIAVALPHLKRARELGCRTIVECTPAYLARDPALLRRLSEQSGLHLLTNTGYYAANGGKHLPDHAHTEDADALARRWVAEWRDGIEGTGIRPGFIKIGMDAGPLSEVARKLITAAARTHLQTGLTIAAHTGNGQAALEQLDVLKAEKVDPSAWIWVHAQNEPDPALRRQAASAGAWIELDGVGPDSVPKHVQMIRDLDGAGHLGRVLVSHDAGWYRVGEPRGGEYRGYETAFTTLKPALLEAGFDEARWQQLVVAQPAAAFTVRRRPASKPRTRLENLKPSSA